MSKTLNTKDFLKKTAKLANKKVGYSAGKDKYFLGSLPLGTIFETDTCRGILLQSSVNAQVQIFHIKLENLDDKSHAKSLVGKSIWSWATEVYLIKLGIIKETNNESLD